MQMESGAETSTPTKTADSMLRFAAHIRQLPDASDEDPKELARRFALSEDVVRDALRVAKGTRQKAARNGAHRAVALFSPANAAKAVVKFIGKHPLLCSFVSSSLLFGAFRYFSSYASAAMDAYGLASFLCALAFLMATNFIRGELRYALYTSATAVFGALLSMLTVDVYYGRNKLTMQIVEQSAYRSILMVILLSAFFSVGAIFGALYRIRCIAREEQRLDRLHLLQRVFVLQERLASPPAEARKEMRFRSLLASARRNWMFVAIGAGLLLGILQVIQIVLIGTPERNPSFIQLSVVLLQLVLNMALFPAVGFASGNWLRGAMAGIIILAGYMAAWMIPMEGLGWETFISVYSQDPAVLINAGILIAMASLGGVGATIDERTEHHRKLETADQAALLTEIIRLRQLLETGSADVCVMVVDCVQSTRMKQNADPLAVEISFREFHEFISQEVTRNGGSVHSVAGDGAVAEFSSIPNAFAAARRIQTLIPEFNSVSNKLNIPFRLRIGLHCGSVHGGLEKVMFTTVIDVAAHIEKLAPAGGIIVTQSVRENLADEKFAQLADLVDGHQVHLSLAPTLE